MAASPEWKVFGPSGDYRAACKHIEDAAALVAFLGSGASIRFSHQKRHAVWTEGAESQSASESYDFVAAVATERRQAHRVRVGARQLLGTFVVREAKP